MKAYKNFVFFLVFSILITLLISAENMDITGQWKGAINIPGYELEIIVNFQELDDGQFTGDISIPQQNASNLPLKDISINDDEVSFMIEGIPGDPLFKGIFADEGDTIEGDFFQGGAELTFTLQRQDKHIQKMQELLAGFEELINRGLEELNVPGVAIAIVRMDEIVFSGGFGYRDLENKEPMTADTILAIGSSTKAFSTFTLGKLVEEGKLEWNKPVCNYIPWFSLYDKQAGDRLTPRDLVTHRSGLPRHDLLWYNNNEISREELVRRLAYLPPTADLREKFQYNNLMYLTAGYLTEEITGKSWEDAVREYIFIPLEMSRSNFSVIDSQNDSDFAYPYGESEGEIKRIPFRDISMIGPAGSINSSINEMAKWLIVNLNSGKYKDTQIIESSVLKDIHTTHMAIGHVSESPYYTSPDYAMGWMVDTYRGNRRIHHGGNIDGFTALVSFLPGKNIGIVILSNKNASALPELLVRSALDIILELEPVDWIGEAAKNHAEAQQAMKEATEKKHIRRKEKTKPAHNLSSYAGLYEHPGYGELKVELKGKELQFIYNGITTPLEHWHYETFNGKDADDPTYANFKITFITATDGNISELRAFFEPTLDREIVLYKKPDAKFYEPGYLEQMEGRYEGIMSQVLTVNLVSNKLMLTIPGQPLYELIPKVGDEFYLKEAPFVVLWFTKGKNGEITILEIEQSGAVFQFNRIEE